MLQHRVANGSTLEVQLKYSYGVEMFQMPATILMILWEQHFTIQMETSKLQEKVVILSTILTQGLMYTKSSTT